MKEIAGKEETGREIKKQINDLDKHNSVELEGIINLPILYYYKTK
jgi:hypothetical protein